MNQRRRGDKRVAFCPGVGNMKPRASLRHSYVNRQHTTFEAGKHLMVDPCAQQCTLRGVLARNQQRAKFDLQNRDRG